MGRRWSQCIVFVVKEKKKAEENKGKNRGKSSREEDGSHASSPCVTGLRGQHSQEGGRYNFETLFEPHLQKKKKSN
jgi:hypothetical protein